MQIIDFFTRLLAAQERQAIALEKIAGNAPMPVITENTAAAPAAATGKEEAAPRRGRKPKSEASVVATIPAKSPAGSDDDLPGSAAEDAAAEASAEAEDDNLFGDDDAALEPEVKKVTKEEMRAKLFKLQELKGGKEVKALVLKFLPPGSDKVDLGQIKEADYGKVHAAAEAAISKAK